MEFKDAEDVVYRAHGCIASFNRRSVSGGMVNCKEDHHYLEFFKQKELIIILFTFHIIPCPSSRHSCI